MSEVRKIEMGERFEVCPACGYKDGFHNIFVRSVENGHMKWLLACPDCSARFDLGLTYSLPSE